MERRVQSEKREREDAMYSWSLKTDIITLHTHTQLLPVQNSKLMNATATADGMMMMSQHICRVEIACLLFGCV